MPYDYNVVTCTELKSLNFYTSSFVKQKMLDSHAQLDFGRVLPDSAQFATTQRFKVLVHLSEKK